MKKEEREVRCNSVDFCCKSFFISAIVFIGLVRYHSQKELPKLYYPVWS